MELFGFPKKYGEAVADGSILVSCFYVISTGTRKLEARDVPLVFVSYVSTWSYVGIRRILVGPNGLGY